MKTKAASTGGSTKLAKVNHGLLIISKKLPGDTYAVTALNRDALGRRYAATAQGDHLRLWVPHKEEEEFDEDKELEEDSIDSSEIEKENLMVLAKTKGITSRNQNELGTDKKTEKVDPRSSQEEEKKTAPTSKDSGSLGRRDGLKRVRCIPAKYEDFDLNQ